MANREPRLMKRGGRYYVRVKVPPELRAVCGRWEYTYSLGTSDLAEARRLCRRESVKIDGEIAKARRKLTPTPVSTLAPSDVEYLAREWFHGAAKARREHVPVPAPAVLDRDDVEAEAHAAVHVLSDPDHPEHEIAVGGALVRLMHEQELTLDGNSDSFRRLWELIRRALLEDARRERRATLNDYSRCEGDILFAGLDGAAAPTRATVAPTLAQLLDAYHTDPSRTGLSPKSKLKDDARARLFKEVIGSDKPVAEIVRADAARLIDLLSILPSNATKRFPKLSAIEAAEEGKRRKLPPISATTAKSYFTAFTALMSFAVDRGWRTDNPAGRLKVRAEKVPARMRRHPFSPEQLKAIFNAPLYRGCRDDEHGYAEPGPNVIRRGRFWVPLLALYTGCRLNELCQLEVSDVTRRGGVDVILIRNSDGDDDTKRVKTEAGERFVPVHPALVSIGLLDHRDQMAAQGEKWLFPELPVGSTGYRSDGFSKWFARFLKAASAKTKRTSFHSFRHSYRDALREADISTERVRALGGWSNGSVEENYGAGLSAAALAKAIAKVRYPDLDLSHLQRA